MKPPEHSVPGIVLACVSLRHYSRETLDKIRNHLSTDMVVVDAHSLQRAKKKVGQPARQRSDEGRTEKAAKQLPD